MPVEEFSEGEDPLYSKQRSPYGEETKVAVIPPEYFLKAMRLAHSAPTAGHGGAR